LQKLRSPGRCFETAPVQPSVHSHNAKADWIGWKEPFDDHPRARSPNADVFERQERQIMIGFASPHIELECQVKAFEDAQIRRHLAIVRREDLGRPPGRNWNSYIFVVLKSLVLFQILRMALDGGVQS
jgi:hypothetical protein